MKYSYGNRSIKSYYRFRIEQDPETEKYTLVKILRKGYHSFFDEFYEKAFIRSYEVTPPPTGSIKLGNIAIFYSVVEDGTTIKKAFRGLNGQGSVGEAGKRPSSCLYRIVGSDYIEVILCDENIRMRFWDRLKEGKLVSEINKLIASK